MPASSLPTSRVGVPARTQGTVLEFLCQRFAHIPATVWQQRLHDGLVCDDHGHPLQASDSVAGIQHIRYQRAVAHEPAIPFEASILFQNEHLLVADKPHFLPVMPAGQYVQQTLLHRLQQHTGLPQLSPLHRIDRDTAGLVLFSTNPASRNAYHALFRQRQVRKIYQAIAPFDPHFLQPREHHSHLAEDPQQFFRMAEHPGPPNSHTRLHITETMDRWARYQLEPITGKRHQLRVHLAALGIPIHHDPYYPHLNEPAVGDYSRPMQLLAQELHFTDPLTGHSTRFVSQRMLHLPEALEK